MARLQLADKAGDFKGSCYYKDFGIQTDGDNPYSQDCWFFDIHRLSFRCTARKEILTVGGYLPHSIWRVSKDISVPIINPLCTFLFDEQFDEQGRCAGEDLKYAVICDPDRRIVQCVFEGPGGSEQVFVSPHSNLIVAASRDEHMTLRAVYFLNVRGFPRNGFAIE